MKNYSLQYSVRQGIKVTLTNLDVEPSGVHSCLISSVLFATNEYDPMEISPTLDMGIKTPLYMNIYFKNGKETIKIKNRFEEIPNISTGMALDYEAIKTRNSTKEIIPFIELIQQIDPIPLSALYEVQALTKLDLMLFINRSEIIRLAEEQKHQQGLQKALKLQEKGDHGVMFALTKFYENSYKNARNAFKECLKSDESKKVLLNQFTEEISKSSNQEQKNKYNEVRKALDNYINILNYVPNTHPEFIQMNLSAYNWLLPFSGTKDKIEIAKILEQLCVASLNARRPQAAHHYDELCGYSGITPSISHPTYDAETLIQIAKDYRKQQNKIEQLKKQINECETTIKELKEQLEYLTENPESLDIPPKETVVKPHRFF